MDGKDERALQEFGESYKKLGEFFGESLSDGVNGSIQGVERATEELGDILLESQAKIYEEIARVEAESEKAQEEKYQREYRTRLSKARTAQQAETVIQNEMFRLQKKANDEYIDELKEFLKQVEAEIKAQKEKIVGEFNEIAERATDSLAELETARRGMAEKMQDYGGVFETKRVVFRNAGPNENPIYYEDTILDLEEERKNLESYASLLEQVKNLEDIPRGLFSIIRQLSIPDAIRYQKELLAMSDEERAGYFSDWSGIQELSVQTASQAYAEDTKQVLAGIEQELNAWYGTIPAGFLVEGELSASFFGQGFMSKMESLKEDIENAVLSVLPVGVYEVMGESAREPEGEKEFSRSVTYVLNSAGETVTEQLRSARSHAEISKMRGDS